MFFFKISMSFLKAFFKDIHNFTFFTKLLVGGTLNKITFFHVFFHGFDVLFKASFAKHNLFTFEKGNFPTRMIYFCVFQKMKKRRLH